MDKRKVVCSVLAAIAMIVGWQQQDPSALSPEVSAAMTSKAGHPLRFSREAMEIMGDAEGCMANPYYCPAGRLTGGIGHANTDDVSEFGIPGRTALQQIPIETISRWFASDMMSAQNCLEQHVEAKTGRTLPAGVFDGIGSFTMNVGCWRMMHVPKSGKPTSLYLHLIAGEYQDACIELSRYVYAGGKKLPGLVTRRYHERQLCDGASQ